MHMVPVQNHAIQFDIDNSYGGIAAPYNNAERQEHVNHEAEYKGASSGTARWVNRFSQQIVLNMTMNTKVIIYL